MSLRFMAHYGDAGERYEVRYFDYKDRPCVGGWAHHEAGARALQQVVAGHPNWGGAAIFDRYLRCWVRY